MNKLIVETLKKHNNGKPLRCYDGNVFASEDRKKAQKMADLCAENGWIAISMKNDWKTIYGEEVTRK